MKLLKYYTIEYKVCLVKIPPPQAVPLPLTLRPTLSQAQCSENVLVVLIPLGAKGGGPLAVEEFDIYAYIGVASMYAFSLILGLFML